MGMWKRTWPAKIRGKTEIVEIQYEEGVVVRLRSDDRQKYRIENTDTALSLMRSVPEYIEAEGVVRVGDFGELYFTIDRYVHLQ